MKRKLLFLIILFLPLCLFAQTNRKGNKNGGFSLSNLSQGSNKVADSLLAIDSTEWKNRQVMAYRLTSFLGNTQTAQLDTSKLKTGNRSLMEGRGLSIGYTGNLGSPAQTRIFSERNEARDFNFADAYDYFITTPLNARFYDTKLPFTDVLYTTAGGSTNKEEELKGTLSVNFGKKINVGGDFDYIYGRGFYTSNGNKLVSYRLFGSYRTDHYDMNAYVSNYNFINHENGGLSNDAVLTNPEDYAEGKKEMVAKYFPVRYENVFNRVKGKQYFLTHRYNLGFTKTLFAGESNEQEVFVPVSSIIHTILYEDNQRRFTTSNGTSTSIDTLFNQGIPLNYDDKLNDVYNYWSLKNTIALSLREGFQNWAKFGLTAFVNFEKRRFRMQAGKRENSNDYILNPDYSISQPTIRGASTATYDEFSTYIGAELSKRMGKIITYNALGELCVVGDDVGEFRANGELRTTFNLFKKEAYVRAYGSIKNTTPAFFQRHFHSRYYWWDKNLNNTQQFHAGGEVNVESTGTALSAGVESIQNYVYYGESGEVEQFDGNIQVITARLKQNFACRSLGWENELAYQASSQQHVLPLPNLSLYSNLYVKFKVAKVLSVQMGADLHYFTSYHAPYYQPATQQFQIQEEVKIGNYPLINGYMNFHLKQARFFIMAYNLGSKFTKPRYFSLAHYPLNPMMLKMGVAVRFNN